MAALTSLLLGIGAAAAAGGTAYNIVSSQNAKADAQKQMDAQNAKQVDLENQAQAQKDKAAKDQADAELQAQQRKQAKLSAPATTDTKGGTILTSPLGVTGNYQRSQKTILGA